MNRRLLLFALMLNGLGGFSQTTTTISYAGLGLSQTNTNVFSTAVWVDGVPNQTLLWDDQNWNYFNGPMYNGSAVVLQAASYEPPDTSTSSHPTFNIYFCDEAYQVGYAFYPNYTYTVSLNLGPVNVPSGWVGSGGPMIGLAVTLGSPQYIEHSVNNTGFQNFIDPTLDQWDQEEGVTWSPHVYNESIYSTPSDQPLYASYLENNSNNQTVTVLPSFTVSGVTQGVNIEAFGSPYATTTAPEMLINSITITMVPVIQPVPISANPSFVCDTQTYSVNTTYPVTWSASPSGLVTLKPSGSNGNYVQIVRTSGEYGNITLTATMNGMTETFPIAIGATSSVTSTENGSCVSGYQAWQLAATPNSPTATNWTWTVTLDNGPYEFTNMNAPNTTVEIDGRLELAVTYKDACGYTSQPGTVVVYSNCNEPGSIHFDATPNPASTTVEILPHRNPAGAITPLIREIKVFDMQGRIRSDVHYGGTTQQQVSVSNLENGVYFVLIYMQDGNIERKKILVQHD